MRQVILDTETTGLRTEDGHRIIEIGCVEMIDRRLTGNHFHEYINPEREVEAAAFAIHGLSNAFLSSKPVFPDIQERFMHFIKDAELIIHNAPFDVGFIDYEFNLLKKNLSPVNDYCKITDTLLLARKMHPGQKNSLDALCKRYGVDNTKRDLHGALMDANLLAQVYLAMTGGQMNFFDTLASAEQDQSIELNKNHASNVVYQKLSVLEATQEEIVAHEKYLQKMSQRGKCAWLSEQQ